MSQVSVDTAQYDLDTFEHFTLRDQFIEIADTQILHIRKGKSVNVKIDNGDILVKPGGKVYLYTGHNHNQASISNNIVIQSTNIYNEQTLEQLKDILLGILAESSPTSRMFAEISENQELHINYGETLPDYLYVYNYGKIYHYDGGKITSPANVFNLPSVNGDVGYILRQVLLTNETYFDTSSFSPDADLKTYTLIKKLELNNNFTLVNNNQSNSEPEPEPEPEPEGEPKQSRNQNQSRNISLK